MATEKTKPETVEVEKEQLEQLIAVNKQLAQSNANYKKDLATIISGFGEVAGMFSGKGLSMGTLTKVLQNKDKLAATMAPAFAVIQKYTTPETPKVNSENE
jgi:hypothetical protein